MISKVHLHSSLAAAASADWNFESGDVLLTLRCDANSATTLRSESDRIQQWTDPLAALAWMENHVRNEPDGRWIGYLSYDLGRLFESLPARAVDDLKLPLFHFSFHRKTSSRCLRYSEDPDRPPAKQNISPTSSFSKIAYQDCVRRAIDYIKAGDVFQVNVSQRFTTDLTVFPRQIWQNLIDATPAAYGAFLDCGDHQIISNSPELFLRVDANRTVTTRPIKGTRPNQPGMTEQLQNSIKDQAELNMIVDLERNDLGRVCQLGSVRVTQPRSIETHPTVLHGVATVAGQLRRDVSFVDLLRATFPGGSITGAPKIRAMQIIDELEPVRRGPYCGAIGYLAGDGSMQFNIAIRTMIVANNKVHIPVGGGIVADSNPSDEYDETIVKARAMFNALGIEV